MVICNQSQNEELLQKWPVALSDVDTYFLMIGSMGGILNFSQVITMTS